MIAALYVEKGGVYWNLPDVDPWDESRDARLYAGPWPVVAHPPCARWGRYWSGGPSARVRRELGDDGGCFAAALESVRKWGGVLEHPEASSAWHAFGIPAPHRRGGWLRDLFGGYTACVEQGHYGHRSRKATWLYVFGVEPPQLVWGPALAAICDDDFESETERRRAVKTGACQRMSKKERAATPPAFRDLLLGIARSVPITTAPTQGARGDTGGSM